MIEIDPIVELIFNHFKKEKVIAFEIWPGRQDKLTLVEVNKNSLVSLKDWHEFKSICIPVSVCMICQMWHSCMGRC